MTINQKTRLKSNKSLTYNKLDKSKNLLGSPQKKGIIVKLFTMTPKKPNSAIRKVAKVQINYRINGQTKPQTVVAYIPGQNHKLTLHNLVLVRPGRTQDLPGIKYKIIKGALDYK